MTARRLRAIGTIVLVAGLVGAALFYWNATRSANPTLDELLPGYSERRARQNAIVMGNLVVTLLELLETMKQPYAQALLIAGTSVLIALCCFRIAPLLDRPPHD